MLINLYYEFHSYWSDMKCHGVKGLLAQALCRVSELLPRGPISVQYAVGSERQFFPSHRMARCSQAILSPLGVNRDMYLDNTPKAAAWKVMGLGRK